VGTIRQIGQSDQVQRSECNVLRARHALHQYASLVSMVAGVVGIGYGLWAVKLSIRVRFHLFITYSNLALAIMVMLAAAFGLACAHPQIMCAPSLPTKTPGLLQVGATVSTHEKRGRESNRGEQGGGS